MDRTVKHDGYPSRRDELDTREYQEEIRRLRRERDEARREARVSKALLDTVYRTLSDTIIVRDTQKRVISSNSPGASESEHCCSDEGAVDEVLATGQALKNRRLRLENGDYREVNAYPVVDEEGNVQFVVEHVRDISRQLWIKEQLREMTNHLESRVQERTLQYQNTIDMLQKNIEKRKQLEKRMKALLRQLELSRRELRSFNYSVSHDLKAPLRIVENYARILTEDYEESLGEEGIAHARRISHAVQRMRTLIDDLLTLSRINRLAVKRSRIDLSALVREAIGEAEQNHGRRVEAEISPALSVYGDQGLLWVGVKNLVDNAVKYAMEREEVRISFGIEERNGRQVFYLSDNGVGFAMEHAEKLFVPFKRLHSSERFSGTGIGLATVQRVVQRHGGEIWAESAPDEGATFYFTLSSAPDIFYPYEVEEHE